MSHELLATLITSGFVVLFWWLFFFVQREYWESRTRQRLFSIRERLFNAAAKGHFEFDDPAYTMARNTINGMLRYTHDMSFLKFIAIIVASRTTPKREHVEFFQCRFKEALDALPSESKQIILRAFADSHHEMMRFMMSTSPILWPILKPASLIARLINKSQQFRRVLLRGSKNTERWRIFDTETYDEGELMAVMCGREARSKYTR